MNLKCKRAGWIVLLPIVILLFVACSSDNADNDDEIPEVDETLTMAPASTDLSVGQNRIVFALIDEDGPIRDSSADVQVSTFVLSASGQEGPIETSPATFRQWPTGPGGVYVAKLNFDRPGTWGLAAIVRTTAGEASAGSVSIEVSEQSETPAIGAPAPRSASKTIDDAPSLDQLTTDTNPDPEMYAMSVAEALDEGKPLMVSFSTPAFCQTATCGPQLEVVKGLKNKYNDQMNFIHIEVYDNPHEIQGDLSNAVISPTLTEWNLPSEPWTFIIDSDGLIASKFEAFTTAEELEESLTQVLAN